MYAIIKTGGKQYRVAEGDVITIEKLEAAANDSVTFEEVLTVVNDGDVKVGAPLVNGAKVTGTVLEHGKGKKILVFKYKSSYIRAVSDTFIYIQRLKFSDNTKVLQEYLSTDKNEDASTEYVCIFSYELAHEFT